MKNCPICGVNLKKISRTWMCDEDFADFNKKPYNSAWPTMDKCIEEYVKDYKIRKSIDAWK